MRTLIFALLLILVAGCHKDTIPTPLIVTTTYSNDMLYGTVNSKDSLVRGFYCGVWDGKQVVITNSDISQEYGVGDFGMKPNLKAGTTYYVWAYAYRKGQEGLAGIGNTIVTTSK